MIGPLHPHKVLNICLNYPIGQLNRISASALTPPSTITLCTVWSFLFPNKIKLANYQVFILNDPGLDIHCKMPVLDYIFEIYSGIDTDDAW